MNDDDENADDVDEIINEYLIKDHFFFVAYF